LEFQYEILDSTVDCRVSDNGDFVQRLWSDCVIYCTLQIDYFTLHYITV